MALHLSIYRGTLLRNHRTSCSGSTFSFTNVNMDQQSRILNDVMVYTAKVDKRHIILDLQNSFVGNYEIDLEIKQYFCGAGVESIQIHGIM